MSSIRQGRPRHGYGKPSHQRTRDTNGTNRQDGDRSTERRDNTPPRTAPKADLHAGPPAWLDDYLENFKKQFITEITQDLMKALDLNMANEVDRKRYQRSYFALRNRLSRMENQQNDEDVEQPQNSAAPASGRKPYDKSQRNRRRNNRPNESTASTSQQERPHDDATNKKEDCTNPDDKKVSKTQINVQVKDDNKPDVLIDLDSDCNGVQPEKDGNNESTEVVTSDIDNVIEQTKCPVNSPVKPSPGVIDSLTEILQLIETEDEQAVKSPKPEDENKILGRKIGGILNKLTPGNINILLPQIKNLEINTDERKEIVINVIFDRANEEPLYAVVYARMCQKIGREYKCLSDFRNLLLVRGETELTHYMRNQIQRALKLKELAECSDEITAKVMQTELEQLNHDFTGTILFIGELFNKKLLTYDFIEKILQYLVKNDTDNDVEYLCNLMKIIGKEFMLRGKSLAPYFDRLEELRVANKLSNKIKIMFNNLVELLTNGWEVKSDSEKESEDKYEDAQ